MEGKVVCRRRRLQARDCWKPSAAGRILGQILLHNLQREQGCQHTLTLDFWLPEPGEHTFLLFESSQLGVVYGSPRKPMHPPYWI